jgi:hypothetical protein
VLVNVPAIDPKAEDPAELAALDAASTAPVIPPVENPELAADAIEPIAFPAAGKIAAPATAAPYVTSLLAI